MQNNIWRSVLLDISVRGATALIAGAMAAWISLQVMHDEIAVQQREIEAHTLAIQHVNDRIDTLQLDIMMRETNKTGAAGGGGPP